MVYDIHFSQQFSSDGFVKLKKYISVYCQQIYKKAVINFDYPVAFLKVSFKCGR